MCLWSITTKRWKIVTSAARSKENLKVACTVKSQREAQGRWIRVTGEDFLIHLGCIINTIFVSFVNPLLTRQLLSNANKLVMMTFRPKKEQMKRSWTKLHSELLQTRN
jgi:hypothetical protein